MREKPGGFICRVFLFTGIVIFEVYKYNSTKMAATKRITKDKVKSELKKAGYKLPHGYAVEKRKQVPKRKKR